MQLRRDDYRGFAAFGSLPPPLFPVARRQVRDKKVICVRGAKVKRSKLEELKEQPVEGDQ